MTKGYILPGSKSMLRLEGFRKLLLANLVIHDHGFQHKKNVYFHHIQSSPHFYLLPPLTLADPHSNCPPLPCLQYVCELSSLIRIASTNCMDKPSLQEQGQLASGCAAEAGDSGESFFFSQSTRLKLRSLLFSPDLRSR